MIMHSCCGTSRYMFLHENILSFLWDICPIVHLLAHKVKSILCSSKEGPNCSPEWLYHLHSYQLCSSNAVSSPHPCQLGVVTIFYFGHSTRYRELFHCGFNLHFKKMLNNLSCVYPLSSSVYSCLFLFSHWTVFQMLDF